MIRSRSGGKTPGYWRSGRTEIAAPARSWEVEFSASVLDHRRRAEKVISTRRVVALDDGQRDVHSHQAHPRGGRI